MKELPKAYDASKIEDEIYKACEDSGYFNPDNLPGKRKESFTISMPPPNVTGVLHVGHAVMLAIQDIVIRFQRMQGKKALWLPGVDHAAIATQAKVERDLYERDKKTRHDLGREEFLKRVNDFAMESRSTIENQIRKMGSSCDWSRERYTLDEGLSMAVQQAFIEMYKAGLIYRGHRIVNWDPKLQTTVSDDEIEYIEVAEPFYYMQYGPFEIATSRPETKFGDKYVVMHPKDKRYKNYKHGEKFEAEWINGKITATVIKDEAIDMELGTGVMTITPWHDATDFDIAERHNLDKEQIIDFDGKLLPIAQEFTGMPIAEARKKIVAKLKKKVLLTKVDEKYVHSVATNMRGGGTIEPQIKEQWFVDVNKPVKKFGGKSLKDKALEVVKKGEIEIIPDRFNKVYYHWLENLRDWCISRQIWFGHRVPAWYKNGEMKVSTTSPGDGWEQDPDTLDTWFSSGLWTFSTLGWPEKTKDLATFHPTALMETGYDILFFWVARMIIMSTFLLEEIPFKHVYLHGLVRAKGGAKMSKSLGNAIDPLDVVKKYGTDAVRLSLVIGATPGNDVQMYDEKIAGFRNFTNKLWNICRFILMTVEEPKLVTKAPKPKTDADEWILNLLHAEVQAQTKLLETYQFSQAGERLRDFTWNELADWYLEIAKIEKGKDEILLYILQTILKLWHPFMPFVTEELWKNLNHDMLMIQNWPEAKGKTRPNDFVLVKDIIAMIRNLRAENKIAPSQKINATIIAGKQEKIVSQNIEIVKGLARLENCDVMKTGERPTQSLTKAIGGLEIHLLVDDSGQQEQIAKEIGSVENYISQIEKKLANKEFVKNAPKEIVDAEKEKLVAQQEKLNVLKARVK